MEPVNLDIDSIYWIGGSPCSGKSTIVDILTESYPCASYHIDEVLRFRFNSISAEEQPCLHRWSNPNASERFWDDIWLRPVPELLNEVFQCYTETFELVLTDLLQSYSKRPVIVEGNCLLPSTVSPLLPDKTNAIWIIATEKFQRTHYPQRGEWVQHIIQQTSDPDQALQNWMDRDVLFAEHVAQEAADLGFSMLRVDGQSSIEENAQITAQHFRLSELAD